MTDLFGEGSPIDRFAGEYHFLSNFYPSPAAYQGIFYPTAEHAFVAAKTNDTQLREDIRLIPKPGQAKRFGRTIELRPNWNEIRISVMLMIVRSKFSYDEMAKLLKATGNRQLIEGNTWNDQFWGVCRGKGKNMLGHILMQVRSEL